jgi:putative DNA primase/helicase
MTVAAFETLGDEPRWVVWRNEERGSKLTKVPYSPWGGRAKADDPRSWGTRAAAEASAEQLVNGKGGGIGIELGDLGGDVFLGGLDLDSCIDEMGRLAAWAAEILRELDSYAERSPSGTGVKAFFYVASEDVRPFLEALGVADQTQ